MQNWRNQNSNYTILIYKVSKLKYKWRNGGRNFMNPNNLIRILVTPITHRVSNWHNLFSNLFPIRI